ncbi:MAG: hypothetical protein ACOCQR_02585 [bacterium]
MDNREKLLTLAREMGDIVNVKEEKILIFLEKEIEKSQKKDFLQTRLSTF